MSDKIIQSNKTLLELAQDMYLEYGRYINKWRAFPLYDDGLKLVERRVLYSEYLTCKDKLTKSAEVVGYCMGKFHPHGNCLRGDTVINLAYGIPYMTIKELYEKYKNKKFYVYSYDTKKHNVVCGLAHSVRIGQVTNEMYTVKLSNGEEVNCTSNHPFLVYIPENNLFEYVEACKLKSGTILARRFLKEVSVVSVKLNILSKPEEFYDITVDKYENFAIGQGIFVHNSSIYGTLVQLVNCGLSGYNGNFGCDIGLREEPPAADRYTEVQMSNDVNKLAFQHLNFVPFESLELPTKEPLYLPTKLPFCLLRGKNYCVGIGFAYRTVIPSYLRCDLIQRLKWLLSDKKDPEPVIKPVTDCILENDDIVYKELLTVGKAKLKYNGRVTLDKANKKIIIYSKCPTKKWKSLLRKFKDEIEVQKCLGYIDESSGSQTKITFQPLKRGQNLDKIYKKIQECISGSVSFQCNMCDRIGNVALVPIDQMLLRTYTVYKKANKDMLEFNISKCQQIIDELTLVEKVKKVLPKWLKEYPDDIDKIIDGVHNDTSIDIKILNEMFEKYTIPRFAKCKTDTSDIQKKMNVFNGYLNDLDNFVWRLYEQL